MDNKRRILNTARALFNTQGLKAVTVREICKALKGVLNPAQDAHIKAKEIKLAQQSVKADADRLLDIRMDLVRSIDPLKQAGGQIHLYFLENIPRWVEMAELENS